MFDLFRGSQNLGNPALCHAPVNYVFDDDQFLPIHFYQFFIGDQRKLNQNNAGR